jgi:glycosyltransferase involved in cell wall biosynthesis
MGQVSLMFSVVIPLYNKEKYIKRAIISVLDQTIQDFEIIVVNDGSTDNSTNIVKSITDKRIKLINQENQGVSVARNTGIENTKNEYIAFLDADDKWEPYFLEEIRKLIEINKSAGLFATNFKRVLNDKTEVLRSSKELAEYFGKINYFKIAAYSESPVWTSAAVINKNVFRRLGGFPAGIAYGEDLLFWCKIALKYRVMYSSKICSNYYIATNNSAMKNLEEKNFKLEIDFDNSPWVSPSVHFLKKRLSENSIELNKISDVYLYINSRYIKAAYGRLIKGDTTSAKMYLNAVNEEYLFDLKKRNKALKLLSNFPDEFLLFFIKFLNHSKIKKVKSLLKSILNKVK